VVLIAFKLGSLVAFVALPWGVFNGTAWVAERPLGWVVGSAMRLFVLAFVASVSITFVNTLPAAFTLDAGGVLNVLLFGATVLALAWFAPILASEVVQGQPHLAGPAIAGGAAVTTVLGVAGTRLAISGATTLTSAGARMIGGKSGGRRFSGGGGAKGAARPAIDYAGMKPPPPPPPAPPPSGGSKT
ncbi:MAG: hypothetical protein NW203_15885, partial [Hyphomonadaceae bacterium]|nr:hypothetical protein [Hyphomonadaceae bacterium]